MVCTRVFPDFPASLDFPGTRVIRRGGRFDAVVKADPGRRALLTALGALAIAGTLGLRGGRALAARGGAATIAALKAGREREHGVVHSYLAYAGKAKADGYRGIAYLFTAFAASEQVHEANFAAALARLGAEVPPLPGPAVKVGTTKENLTAAVVGEIDSIDTFYPKLLAQLKPEGDEEAMSLVRYAWASEQQHRDRIRQLQKWTGAFFEKVARHIDEKTGQYYVCGRCGSTVDTVPAAECPVCKGPPTSYRHVPPPT